ncbi:MFS transporter [Candidatus Uhrbacteria bacterium]|nr:MFS transporter [Candidatus Uhrbacteria bacterium]
MIDPEKLNLTAKVFREILGTGGTGVNQSWWMFLFPALFGLFWFIPIALTLRNRPEDAGFKGFETGDEHISAESLTMMQMLKEVFLNPKHRVLMIVCLIEFCSGAIRNGSIHVFPKFAKNVGFRDDFWVTANWGLVLLIAGVLGANATGWVSDKMFNSRRGPMALVLYALVMIGICMITFSLGANAPKNGSLVTGIGIFIVLACIIGVHGILSGTASADFAGVKNTAKSVGIVDGAVYAGTSLQAFLMGMFIPIDDKTAAGKAILADPNNWLAWPVIILPFVVVGTILGMRIYHAYPNKSRSH